MLFSKVLENLLSQGVKSLGIYGAGKHSERLLQSRELHRFDDVVLLDDNPELATVHWKNRPCLDLDSVPDEIHTILISSDAYEQQMVKRVRRYRPHVHIVTLYS